MPICPKCGANADEKWNFCAMCAHPLSGQNDGGGDPQPSGDWMISACARCKGGGRLQFIKGNFGRGGQCEGCGGFGHIAVTKDAKPCGGCRGEGKINVMGRSEACDKCRGHGFSVNQVIKNPPMDQSDVVDAQCQKCSGTGRFDKGKCASCGAKGTVSVFKGKLPCGFCANKGMLSNNSACHVCGGCGWAFAVDQ